MIDLTYKSKSTGDLLYLFAKACQRIDETYLTKDVEAGNAELKDVVFPIRRELRARSIEAQRAALPLLQNPNLFVCLHAAKCFYPAVPVEANKCLQELFTMKYPDVSLDAGMTLRGLETDPHCLDWDD